MDLSIIIPTYNEKDNLAPLAARIMDALGPRLIEPEILIIDDNSPDGTAGIAQGLSGKFPIRVIRRIDKKGLGSAILEGIQQARAAVICVMDADLSHPPEAIPEMYKKIENGEAQLVIGSRKVAGGGTSEWIWYRKVIHTVARGLGAFLTPVKDITSGFFMFDRKIIENVKLEPRSWKIGLEIIVKGSYDKALEYPIVFVEREAGQSKMGIQEVVAYLAHLCSLALYKIRTKRK
jgi:dolichol-phosphate mannosyltransferase